MSDLVSISITGLDKAIKYFTNYRVTLEQKFDLFSRKLADKGLEILNTQVGNIDSESLEGTSIDTSMEITKGSDSYTVEIHAKGEKIAFIEFGAGVFFNGPVGSSKHPKGQETGMTIGSYNPQSNNASRNTWVYIDDSGEKVFTHGTPTYAPVYHTSEELEKVVYDIFREVFG